MANEVLTQSADPAEIRKNIVFHDTLNPKLWRDDQMRLEVRVRLLRIAIKFYQFLDIPGLKIHDIVMTGSNAAFNYTALSDIDIHLIVDFEASTCPKLAENFFNTKKNLWNLNHSISIRGFNTELYVEDVKSPARSNGLYSLIQGEWIEKPRPEAPKFDDSAVIQKTTHMADQIDDLLENGAEPEQLESVLTKLRTMRQSGLEKGGEFSVENLTFKSLRSLGYLDRLRQARAKAEDDSLSL